MDSQSGNPSASPEHVLPAVNPAIDVSDLKEVEQSLVDADRSKDVIEINDDECEMPSSMLALPGHQVQSAADGLKAIEVAKIPAAADSCSTSGCPD